MSSDRMIRVNELLRREIAEVLFHVIDDPGVDLSAVTITHVVASRNLRHARVLVSIRNSKDRGKSVLGLLEKRRGEIQRRINKDLYLKYTPRLSFELDTSLQKGDQVLSLLFRLETESPSDEGDENR